MEDVKFKLQHIINGNGQISGESKLKKVQNFLREHACASQAPEKQEYLKREEEKFILTFGEEDFFFVADIDATSFISEGAEQKVYRHDDYSVIKLNS